DERPLEVTSSTLSNLQAAANADEPVAPVASESSGAGLATDDIFADPEPEPAATVEAASAAEPAPPPAATTTARTTPTPQPAAEASLLDKVIATVLQPMTLYAVGAAMLLLLAVGFVLRRRNRDADDVTG